jgi:uncharacterized protein
MKCPVDTATLLMTERQGVEIDYCPECRGVWLDRGELDKLVRQVDDDWDDDRARQPQPDRYERDRYERDRYDSHRPKKKKKGWLSEMFEMD